MVTGDPYEAQRCENQPVAETHAVVDVRCKAEENLRPDDCKPREARPVGQHTTRRPPSPSWIELQCAVTEQRINSSQQDGGDEKVQRRRH